MICRVLDLGVAWWSWKGGWVQTTGATGLFLKRRIGTTCEVGGYTLIRVNSSGKGFTIFFLLLDTWRRYDMIWFRPSILSTKSFATGDALAFRKCG